MIEIKKAVIPAAGLGTRFLPATKSMPKEMLPLINKPAIHFVVEEAIQSGIEDIIIITGRGKRAIEDYFDHSPELETYLKENRKDTMFDMVMDISSLADIHYIRQKEPKGLGDAILRAERHIGDDPFAVLLGDDIIVNPIPCTKQLISGFQKCNHSILAVEKIPRERISNYGIINGKKLDSSFYQIEDIVEKPAVEQAPSDLGAIGRYIFTSDIFDCLKKTEHGYGNEIQLTDGIRLLKDTQPVYAYLFKGKRYDTGDMEGYVKAIIDFALMNPELRENILKYLKEVIYENTKYDTTNSL